MTDAGAPNILIVDDTPENLRLLTTILSQLGYEVRPVTDGRQALQASERHPPDLVLLDINMPDMNGYEVCSRLKAHERLKDIPVIFLTALSELSDKVRAFEVGGVDYITKPFQLEEVHARVKTHLSLRRANLELHRSYEKLEALEKLRDDLVHMVVHDMRSPLSVLLVNLELLQADLGRSSENASNDLRAAISGVQALRRMTNDLLDIRRLEEGKLPVESAEHDLGTLAATARASIAGLAQGRTIDLEVQSPLHVSCDEALIRRVLENLVGNAIKHTQQGSSIRIVVTTRDGRARVVVLDEGPGVPSEARQKIFEKFGTVTAAKKGKYHSAGLGLAFCKLAVEAHGGAIGVEPREPRGSAFWFELPGAA